MNPFLDLRYIKRQLSLHLDFKSSEFEICSRQILWLAKNFETIYPTFKSLEKL